MTTSIHAKSIIAIFAVAAIAPVATAGAYPNEPVIADHNSSALSSTPADTPSSTSSLTALSHDSSATPSSATLSSASSLTALSHDSSGTVALRRDGSQAVPVVASLSPQPSTSSDGFDWGDAAIGAGAALLLASIAMAGSAAVGGRRSRTSRPATAASQSA